MRSFFSILLCCATIATFTGCAGYQLGSNVPQELRAIHVPAFENQTSYPMVGAVAAQQFLSTMIEDGTFTPSTLEDARLRLQVIITNCGTQSVRYDRNNVLIPTEYYLTIYAKVYLFDAQTGAVYIDGKTIKATETMLTRDQYQIALTNTLPLVSRKLARNILDELQTIR
jgi:hypothetical protein